MYVICGLYLFAPIISKWILDDNRASMRFYLGYLDVHFLSSLLNLISPGFSQLPGQSLFCSQQLRRFSGLHGIGYLSEALPDVRQQKQVLTCCAAVLLFSALLFVLRSFLHILPAGFIYDNLCFISIVYVYTIFTIIQYASRFITAFSPCLRNCPNIPSAFIFPTSSLSISLPSR